VKRATPNHLFPSATLEGIGLAPAIRKALERAGMKIDQLG
jgi:hypothetical protein